MEHIIQFGITIDDDAIKKHIEEKAIEQISDKIVQSIKENIFGSWGRGFSEEMEELIRELLKPYTDKIVEDATAQVVDSIKRSKKYKAALAQIAEEMISE